MSTTHVKTSVVSTGEDTWWTMQPQEGFECRRITLGYHAALLPLFASQCRASLLQVSAASRVVADKRLRHWHRVWGLIRQERGSDVLS